MASSDNSVEIKITGTLDPSLAASTATAKAAIGETATAATAATGGMQGAASATTAMGSASTAAAAEIKKVSGAIAETSHVSPIAVNEVRALFDELSSGRMYRSPGTIAIIAQKVLGLSTAALVAGGTVAILAAGVGYLVYEALKGSQELDNLAEAFRLTGRGAEVSRQNISDEIGFLSSLQGVSHATALAFMKLASVHADVSAELTDQVGQLLPAFVDAYGKQAPEAAGKLLETLSNLTESGFKRLDNELLNLSPQEYEQIKNLIEIGNTAKATSLILQSLSGHAGVYIKSLGDQVYDTEQKISQLKRQLSDIESSPIILARDGTASRLSNITTHITDLTNHLAGLRKEEDNQGKQQSDNNYKRQIDDADKINARLDQQATITKQIAVFQTDLAEARKRGDAAGIASFNNAIANEEKKLDELKQRQSSKQFHSEGFSNTGAEAIDQARERISEINAVEGQGAQERLAQIKAIWEQVLSGAKLNAAERLQVHRELNTAIAQANKQSAHEQKEIDTENTRTEIELERIAYQQRKAELDQEVAAGRMTKQQELQILIDYIRKIEQLQLDALNIQEQNYDKDSIAFARAEDQKKIIAARTDQEIAQLQARLAADTTKTFGNALTNIESAEERMVHGLFSGTQSFKQTMFQAIDEIVEKWLIGELKTLTQHVMTEDQKTAATVAGVAARNTAEAAGRAAASASNIASGGAQIMNDAYKAAAGAYQSVVGIPVVGPVLAPIAAGTAFAAVAAFDVLTSASGGQWQVVRDGQLTELHRDEMVLPAWAASPIRSMVQSGALPGDNGNANSQPSAVHVHFNVSAIDGPSVSDFFNKNLTMIARRVAKEWNRTPSLRPGY